MNNEKPCGEDKARRGLCGVRPRPEGGSRVADDGLCDSEQAKRNGGAAETVLHEADRRAQQESRRRVSAAEAEINHHKQWQIEQSGPRKMQREPGLNHQREQRGNGNRAGAELVHLDVGLAHAEVKGAVHGLATWGGAGFDATGAGGLASGASFPFSGCRVSRTSTSSSFSRFAAGLMRICLKLTPGWMAVMVPTGRSRGKMRSMPLVMTRSPTLTSSSFGTYFMVMSGSPTPPTGLWMRESASMAPTPLCLSVSRSTCEVLAHASITFPTTPSVVMTPLFRRIAFSLPRASSIVRLSLP